MNKNKGYMLASFVGSTMAALSAILMPKRKDFMSEMRRRTDSFADRAKNVSDNVYGELKTWTAPSKPKKSSFFLTGAFLGALIGAGSALLFTPKTGKQIRNSLTKRYQDVSELAEESLHALQPHHTVRRRSAKPASHARAAIRNVKSAVHHGEAAAEKTIKRVRTKVKKKIDDVVNSD